MERFKESTFQMEVNRHVQTFWWNIPSQKVQKHRQSFSDQTVITITFVLLLFCTLKSPCTVFVFLFSVNYCIILGIKNINDLCIFPPTVSFYNIWRLNTNCRWFFSFCMIKITYKNVRLHTGILHSIALILCFMLYSCCCNKNVVI